MRRYTILQVMAIILFLSFIQSCNRAEEKQRENYVVPSAMCVPVTVDKDWYSSGKKAPLFDGLEGIDFEITTTSEEAQNYFKQGLMLAYGFNHAEAARSFFQGTREDSTCAMCWWGFAYVLGPNYNAGMEPDNYERAYEAARQAIRHSEGLPGEERALIEAIASRYSSKPREDRTHLDEAYAAKMKEAYEKYPDNSDIASLYAESLMNLHPWDLYDKAGKPMPWTPDITLVLEITLKRDPDHAMANHLYIHAVEAAENPQKGMASAKMLEDLVPGAAHLLHMPSHLYINTGDYHEGSVANIRAIRADSNYVTRCHAHGVYPLAYYPHNYHFLAATATLEGDRENALMAANEISEMVNKELMRDASWATLQHYYVIPYHVYVKFGEWDAILGMPEESLVYPKTVRHYARGMAFLAQGETENARKELEYLKRYQDEEVLKEMTVWEINSIHDLVLIARDVLEGEILAREENYEKSIAALESALEREDALNYNEPPDWFFSVRHHLGNVLLDAGRHQEAIAIFLEDLEIYPRNGWAYSGLVKAYKALGDDMKMEDARVRFDESWQYSDVRLDGAKVM